MSRGSKHSNAGLHFVDIRLIALAIHAFSCGVWSDLVVGCVFQDTMVHIGVMKDITCIISECTQDLWFISVYLMMNTCCEA